MLLPFVKNIEDAVYIAKYIYILQSSVSPSLVCASTVQCLLLNWLEWTPSWPGSEFHNEIYEIRSSDLP